jgi:alkanesulfonate monooxygenase SsuD/methylene tetrahydromethanopterin reductase-like flavin-dependent oxidoreductase (luciferase family)
MAALYIGGMGARDRNFYNQLAIRYGYADAAKEIQDLYLDGKKAEAAAKVPHEFLELSNLVGSEGYVKDRLAAYQDAGVTVLNAVPIDPDPTALLEKLKAWTD